jgi:hypothetical protein
MLRRALCQCNVGLRHGVTRICICRQLVDSTVNGFIAEHGDSSFLKLFANFTDCASGWVALYRDSERLEFRFRPREIPYAGLWFTNGGWHGYTHLAIEPTNTLGDRATADAAFTAFEERRWHFRVGC